MSGNKRKCLGSLGSPTLENMFWPNPAILLENIGGIGAVLLSRCYDKIPNEKTH